MNVIIPDGWFQVPLNKRVLFHDLEWDRIHKGWIPVKKYGSFCKRNRRKYIIRQEIIQGDLMMALRHFPNAGYSIDRNSQKEFLMAYILFLAGVQDININIGFISGQRKIENILFRENSVSAYPYIELPSTNGINILWFLLRKLNIAYGGGASSDKDNSYMQACWTNSESFICKLIVYFNVIKKEFPVIN